MEPGPSGTTNLTLNLLPGDLASGDTVHVYWQSLPTASGKVLSGIVTLLAA